MEQKSFDLGCAWCYEQIAHGNVASLGKRITCPKCGKENEVYHDADDDEPEGWFCLHRVIEPQIV